MMSDFQHERTAGYDIDQLDSMKDNMEELRERSRSPLRRSRSRSPLRRRDGRFERPAYGERRDRDTRWMKRVVLANVPYDIRWPEIKDLFKEKVGEAPYVEIFESPEGKSRGMALLEFKDPMLAEKSVEALNRYELKGRAIIVRIPKDKDKREYEMMRARKSEGAAPPLMMGGAGGGGISRGIGGAGGGGGMGGMSTEELRKMTGDGPITNRVFVANLDYNVTEAKVREIFKMAGNVESIEMKNGKDGNFKGMCVIQFQYPLEAVQAISMFHNQMFYDRNMVVKIDRDPAGQVEERIPNKLPSGLRSIGAGLGQGGRILNVRDGSLGPLQSLGMAGGGMAGGLSGGVGSLRTMSSGGNLGGVMREELSYGSSSLDSGIDRLPSIGGLSSLGGGGMMGSQSLMDSMPGASLAGYSSLSGGMGRSSGYADIGASSSVVVKNLPYSVDWKELKDRFRSAGDVVFAEIMSRGIGLVRFSSVDEARRAIRMMNGMRLQGRELECSFER